MKSKSNGIRVVSLGNGQKLNTATPMDNNNGMPEIKSSILDTGGFKGGPKDISRTLSGAAVSTDIGD